jgi:hypothetical protein
MSLSVIAAMATRRSYPPVPAVYGDGDLLGARALASGDVEIYRNGTLVGTVGLDAADQAFFNPCGGHVGTWTLGAPQSAARRLRRRHSRGLRHFARSHIFPAAVSSDSPYLRLSARYCGLTAASCAIAH